MAGLTRANVIELAEAVLNADGDLHWPDTTVTEKLAQAANRHVWRILAQKAPQLITTVTGPKTYTAGAASMSLTTMLGQQPRGVLEIVETSENAAIGQNNEPWPWSPTEYTGRHYLREAQGRWRWSRLVSGAETRYSVVGDDLYADPVPTTNRFIHFAWIPAFPTNDFRKSAPFTLPDTQALADAAEALDGLAEDCHDAVWVRLAYLMNMRDNHNPEIPGLWREHEMQLRTLDGERRSVEPYVVGVG
jgi:hypothetical protein